MGAVAGATGAEGSDGAAGARLEAAERRRVAGTAQQVAAGQLLLHDPQVRLAVGPEQEAQAYERLHELEASIGLPPTPYVDVPKQEFAKQIHAGQVTVAERALPAGERETLLEGLADATIARFGSGRVARYMVDLRNQQTLAQAAMSQAQGKPEAPEQAQQPGGPARSVAPHQQPEPMTAREAAAPATAPMVSGPSVSRPPRPQKARGSRGRSSGPFLPDQQTLSIFEEACKEYNVPLDLALAVGYQESRFNQKVPSSRAGAIGVMQLMPKTAAGLGVDPSKERENIFGGVKLLAGLLAKHKSVDLALVAYNAGPKWVAKAGKDWNSLPRETRNYVPSVKRWRKQYAAMLAPKSKQAPAVAGGKK